MKKVKNINNYCFKYKIDNKKYQQTKNIQIIKIKQEASSHQEKLSMKDLNVFWIQIVISIKIKMVTKKNHKKIGLINLSKIISNLLTSNKYKIISIRWKLGKVNLKAFNRCFFRNMGFQENT